MQGDEGILRMKQTTRSFNLGPYALAADSPPVFLAEIGGFFGQDMDLASAMIRRIIQVGRDVPQQPMILKTEILHDAAICIPSPTTETYAAKDGRVQRENYRALIERKVVPLAHYAGLLQLCRDEGMPFLVSVYDFAGADFAVQQGAVALKLGSPNIVHLPLLRHCASKGLPMVLDTGRATLGEVQRALDVVRQTGCENVVLEHSPDGHPALPKAHNLRILETYLQAFGLPVGLSDHHVGIEMLFMSIALGACVLEKGVHVAPDDLDIDISHAMNLDDLREVLLAVHGCWQALGAPTRDMSVPIEGVLGTSQRQCLVARGDLSVGQPINLQTVRFAFPRLGVGVEHWDLVEGWQLRKPVKAGEPVQWNDIEPAS
jgi:sialic acid synthase SpsE